MIELYNKLSARLQRLEQIAYSGVIPGMMDSYEMEQVKGRIKELKSLLNLMKKGAANIGNELPPS